MKDKTNLVPYSTIKAATESDALAIHCILKHYERYINKLSTKTFIDESGNPQYIIDKDMQDKLYTALLQMILDFTIEV